MRYFFKLSVFVAIVISGACNQHEKTTCKVGLFFPDVMHGITYKFDNDAAFLFRIGFMDEEGKYIKYFNEHRFIKKDTAGQKYGTTAPDFSYAKYGFETGDGNTIWLEWSKTAGGAVGKVYSESPREIFIEAMPSFPNTPNVFYLANDGTISGYLDSTANIDNRDWYYKVLDKESLTKYHASHADSLQMMIENKASSSEEGTLSISASLSFQVSIEDPLYFTSGCKEIEMDEKAIEERLSEKLQAYQATRFKIETPMGEIWEAVSNHHNLSKVYGTQSKLSGHVVNRGWCAVTKQRLFEWDTFLQGMMAALEDPEGGKESVRAILFHQRPNGLVPNTAYGNDTTANSIDRSQPPVGAISVWKLYQYQPDREFLAEVYPKLLKWHNWWFDIRPANGLPYRDGNQNGLLEWGSEIESYLQGAKYESGQDNSPMFDDARMNEKSRTMEIDMVGLSGLWAADALYLSYMAKELGREDEARELKQQAIDMSKRIDSILWNEDIGMYCNKYWDKYSRAPELSAFKKLPVEVYGQEEVTISYLDNKGNEISRKVKSIQMDDKDLDIFNMGKIPATFSATLQPIETGTYFFYTPEEMGVVLKINGQQLIDNRKFWITEFVSNPIYLEEGKDYEMEFTYTGDIPFELLWTKEQPFEGSLFSERVGPTNFYPLIAGKVDTGNAKEAVEFMMDTNKFWGEYVIPTISRDDPAFPSQGYWRGRIWPPTNYLTYLGIDNYASDSIVWQYALKSARMAQNEWLKQGHLHENYYASGSGTGTEHYCWGGLMQTILLEEIAGINPEGEIVSNPYATSEFTVINYPVKGEIIEEFVPNKE
jgi:glycogen debranching enzyme